MVSGQLRTGNRWSLRPAEPPAHAAPRGAGSVDPAGRGPRNLRKLISTMLAPADYAVTKRPILPTPNRSSYK
jgi:hypothetical protein